MPCRINVFSGRKRERSPRENPPKGDFVGFSHGDLSPHQAKIRQTVAENATHGMSRTFVCWAINTMQHFLVLFVVLLTCHFECAVGSVYFEFVLFLYASDGSQSQFFFQSYIF